MAEFDTEDKPRPKPIPYKIMVQYEGTLRFTEDFWKFRTATNVLRQSHQQIENYIKRYEPEQ